ncbi:MAG: hypothetical protein JWN41_332, partial [Thermoleophilia bacterium]|nr:hypothetical protein [Thermoleophilia bacterium]
VPSSAASVFRLIAESHGDNFPVTTHGAIEPGGVLGVSGGAVAPTVAVEAPQTDRDELALFVAPFLYDAPEVVHTPAMEFLRDTARLTLNRADARQLGLTRGDRAQLEFDGHVVEVTVVTSTRLTSGHVRIHAGTPGVAPGRSGWHSARVTALAAAHTAAVAEGAAT